MSKPLVVLWFGGGQDTTALLYEFTYNEAWRQRYVGDAHFIVVMANTGNEFRHTYQHTAQVRRFCRERGIEFYFLSHGQGYHMKTWPTLQYQLRRNNSIMSVAFPKSCSDNLKVKVCYNFLEDYLRKQYGFTGKGKAVFYEYKARFGKLKSIIGFTKGEEGRVAAPVQLDLFGGRRSSGGKRHKFPKWMRYNIEHVYPLIEFRRDRAAVQRVIESYGHEVPMPSNCRFCPFQNGPELVYLERFHPSDWQEWVQLEAAKLERSRESPRNLGVRGAKPLPVVLEEEKRKYGHWTDEQLIDYKMSHGHCVKSKF